MTLNQQLKNYITDLFYLSNNEDWECEAIDEVANDILPEPYFMHTPLNNETLHTYTYYSEELNRKNVHPFLLYLRNTLIAIGYVDDNYDMDFIYLTDTQHTYVDQRYLLEKRDDNNE